MTIRYRHSGYWEAFPYSSVAIHHFHISYSHNSTLGIFVARYYLLCLFEKDTEWYPMDHWWLVLVFRLRNAEKSFVHLRPVGVRFAIVLNEQRSRLWGYEVHRNLRAGFSIWKCPMQGSWVRTLFMYPYATMTPSLKILPQERFLERIWTPLYQPLLRSFELDICFLWFIWSRTVFLQM